jgi:hypothetical protein
VHPFQQAGGFGLSQGDQQAACRLRVEEAIRDP